MPNRHVQIQRLTVNLQGVAPATAQAALASLGASLTQALSNPALLSDPSPSSTAATIQLRSASDPVALRQAVAQHVARTVAARLHATPPRF